LSEAGAPNPDSVVSGPAGGSITLKVHRAIWSGTFPANSLAAIAECCAARVARAEIDVQFRRDGGFVVFHDDRLDRSTDASGAVADQSDAARRRCMGSAISVMRSPRSPPPPTRRSSSST